MLGSRQRSTCARRRCRLAVSHSETPLVTPEAERTAPEPRRWFLSAIVRDRIALIYGGIVPLRLSSYWEWDHRHSLCDSLQKKRNERSSRDRLKSVEKQKTSRLPNRTNQKAISSVQIETSPAFNTSTNSIQIGIAFLAIKLEKRAAKSPKNELEVDWIAGKKRWSH